MEGKNFTDGVSKLKLDIAKKKQKKALIKNNTKNNKKRKRNNSNLDRV